MEWLLKILLYLRNGQMKIYLAGHVVSEQQEKVLIKAGNRLFSYIYIRPPSHFTWSFDLFKSEIEKRKK